MVVMFIARDLMVGKEKALEDFNEAIRLNPVLEIAHVNRGSCWLSRSDMAKR